MPKFLCIHTMPPKSMTFQQACDFAQLTQRDPVVKGLRSAGNLTEGKVACVLESPAKQDLVNFFRKNHMPFDSITELEFEGESGTLTPTGTAAIAGRP
jgi:hypothetical protein